VQEKFYSGECEAVARNAGLQTQWRRIWHCYRKKFYSKQIWKCASKNTLLLC